MKCFFLNVSHLIRRLAESQLFKTTDMKTQQQQRASINHFALFKSAVGSYVINKNIKRTSKNNIRQEELYLALDDRVVQRKLYIYISICEPGASDIHKNRDGKPQIPASYVASAPWNQILS